MPVLTLKYQDKLIKKLRIQQDKGIRIGRRPENDLVINESAVSGFHAEIEPENGVFYITDRQSRNGTFLNKELIISRRLNHNDVINIGTHVIEFAYEDNEERPPEQDDTGSFKTMIIDTRQHRDKLAREMSKMASRQKQVVQKTIGVLTSMDASGTVYSLNKDVFRIGKSTDADIQVKGFMVGKTAAIITRIGNEYRLAPAEGMAKPKINYQSIRSEVVLKEFDVIEVGSMELQFHYKTVSEPQEPSLDNASIKP